MNWDKIKNVIIGLLTIICIILIFSTTCSLRHNVDYRNNIEALTDSVHVYKLKNGELLYSKKMLTGDLSNAEHQLGVTKKQLKEIERQLKSKTEQLTKIEATVKIDTIVMHDSVFVEDSVLKSNFRYNDRWVAMNGTVKVNSDSTINTTLNSLTMDVPLLYGVTDNNQVVATSENNYITIRNLNAIKKESDEKDKHWSIGLQIGFGAQYGLRYNKMDYGPYFGIGVSYGFCF